MQPLNEEFKATSSTKYYSFSKGEKGPAQRTYRRLYEIKKSFYSKDGLKCIRLTNKYRKNYKTISNQLLNQQLQCALILDTSIKSNRGRLKKIVNRAQNQLLKFGGQRVKSEILENYVKLALVVFENSIRDDRPAGWGYFENLQAYLSVMTKEQKYFFYKTAGELAFIQQKVGPAKIFFQRSLEYKDSNELKDKLRALDPRLFLNEPSEKENQKDEVLLAAASDAEKELVTRLRRTLQAHELVLAIDDGVQIISQFPSSFYAQWAEKEMLRIYFNLTSKSAGKYALVKFKIRKLLHDLDGPRLLSWAKKFFYRGYYADSYWFASQAALKLEGQVALVEANKVAARSLHYIGKYTKAAEYYQKIYEMSTGTKGAVEALFRWGLIRYRQKEYSKASSLFERLLALSEHYGYEVKSLYWLWRSRQNLENSNAVEPAKKLYTKYPLTYYGIRAYAENNGGLLNWVIKEPMSFSLTLNFTQYEREAYENYKLFVKSGWYLEAENELSLLPQPKTAQQNVFMANLWVGSHNIKKGIELTSSTLSNDLNFIRKNIVQNIFPRVHKTSVDKWATKNKISPYLVYALLRQESAFDARAVSPSNAVGLMQLVSGTAEEVRKDLSVKKFTFPESLFEPDLNIRFGSFYLKKMIRANQGYIPLALASYNAGIGRLYRWMTARKDLVNLRMTTSSSPESEIWIDEMPWSETRLYVKFVMRNMLIYKLLDQSRVELTDPLWN